VAVCVGQCFVKLDWDSNIIWTVYEKVHHDVAISRDGSYYVPFDGDFWNYNQRIVKFDGFLHISPNGEVLERWSVAENLKMIKQYHAPTELDEPPAMKEKNPQRNETYDYYHLNTIELLPETPLGKKDSRFQEGNYLLCLRNVSLIVILDKESLNVVWHWGPGILDWPHMPTMLENGNLLIFDNGTYREYSRVIEINPLTGEVVWEYRAKDFYSKFRGSSQRFPNGNTLICESEEGHVFEVTRHGKIVWEFYNPEIKEKKRKRIYRMLRYSKEHMKSLLKQRFREIEKLPF
jgi:outer membrane protein assembly factor BamB